ncbi:protein FAM135A [Dermatophagoides farinae]|uniref:protein FAM135A n=1 Tax=Dermatophagoides farinae TaxID=6954 RepID=UPI003F5DCB70
MPELQAIVDFSIQINKFVNIDLFQRGFYQIRLSLKLPNCKLVNKIELNHLNRTNLNYLRATKSDSSFSNFIPHTEFPHNNNDESNGNVGILLPSCIINGMATSKTFQINYKNEEILLNDTVSYRMNICLDIMNCMEQMQKTNIELNVELWYSDQEFILNQYDTMICVSTRQLRIHFDLCRGIHYSLPVIFDYFHLSAVTISLHGCLVQLCQPYISSSSSSSSSSSLLTSKNTNSFTSTTSTNWLSSLLKQSTDGMNGKKIDNNQFMLQLWRIQLAQWKLVSIMSLSLLNLKRALDEYYRILTPWHQAKINYDRLFVKVSLDNFSELSGDCFRQIQNHLNDVHSNLNVENVMEELFAKKFPENNFHSCLTDGLERKKLDDIIDTIEHDVAHLCGLTIEQWQRFLMLVQNSERINQHLAKLHHFQRIRRFSEGFFLIEHPRMNLNGSLCDQNSNLFLELSDNLRKSSYFINLPPCDVECIHLDGDYNTLPIIFEEKFQYTKQSEPIVLENGDQKKSIKSAQSPSKLSLSSSTTTSSSTSPKSNSMRFSFFSRFNNSNNSIHNNNNNGKPSSTSGSSGEKCSNQKIQKNCHSNIKTMEIFELYKSELFTNETQNNQIDLEQMNRKIKLLNSFLTKKNNMIKNYSQLSMDFQNDKIFKKPLTNSPSSSSSQNSNSEISKPSSLTIESSNNHSWPELSPKTIISDEKGMKKASNDSKKKHHNHHQNKDLESSTKILDIFPCVNYQNFPGTMYFPKPPKEFAMEEMIDEPVAHEVCMKPIPTDQQENNIDDEQSNMESTSINPKIIIEDVFSNQLNHHSKMNNSLSFQDLTKIKTTTSTASTTNESTVDDSLAKQIVDLKNSNKNLLESSKDDIYLKSNNLNHTKFTFMELLQSDHCLICCGSIDAKRANDSWPCKCIRTPINCVVTKSSSSTATADHTSTEPRKDDQPKLSKNNNDDDNQKTSITTPPPFRRVSLFDTEFISFLGEKETFRNSIAHKVQDLMFYSDFSTLASRIPYFQCDADFKSFKDLHLIVCVHGLDGNSADLRLVKTYLEIGLPTNNFEFLMSQRNQGETFDSLETLTERLINEIENFISTLKSKPSKISFIGHSLGNIIIRAAISRSDFLKRWRNKFHTFLSLSGPHLGLAYNRSGLVNMGLWFIQKFKRAQSLNQLSMKDATDIKQTFLYRLSKKPGIEFFRNILLCGSTQDYYVPIHSAHIELCNAAINDQSEYGIAYREMTDNIIQRFMSRPELNIIRYDVHHALNSNTNSLIGRAAHIAVLDSELFIEKFMMVTGLGYFV